MPTSGEFSKIPKDKIRVPADRQRTEFKGIEELGESIRRNGLIQPIVLTRDFKLVAGERRFRAFFYLAEQYPNEDWTEIPFQYFDELEVGDRKIVELEENIRRVDLPWKDATMAVYDYVELRRKRDPNVTLEACGEALGVGVEYVSQRIAVAKALLEENLHVMNATTFTAARNVLWRQLGRQLDVETEAYLEVSEGGIGTVLEEEEETSIKPDSPKERPAHPFERPVPKYRPASEDIVQGDALEFFRTYSGTKFNFLHCDFPFGVNMQESDQAGHDWHQTYEDTPDTYFALLQGLLENKDRVIARSAHLMFWFSMKYYRETVQLFEEHGFKVDKFPLIWYKSDKKGILPDYTRGPRRIYETALLISRGDRKIVSAVPNCFDAPTPGKSRHFSQKPLLVVHHFLRMFVDESTLMLDPTCGSGTALVAGTMFRARVVRGLDIDQENVDDVRRRINEQRLQLAEGGGKLVDLPREQPGDDR